MFIKSVMQWNDLFLHSGFLIVTELMRILFDELKNKLENRKPIIVIQQT